ncbi:hypothetical protein ANTQUA_LOCUS4243 [Anthophora quadrimaculata]
MIYLEYIPLRCSFTGTVLSFDRLQSFLWTRVENWAVCLLETLSSNAVREDNGKNFWDNLINRYVYYVMCFQKFTKCKLVHFFFFLGFVNGRKRRRHRTQKWSILRFHFAENIVSIYLQWIQE